MRIRLLWLLFAMAPILASAASEVHIELMPRVSVRSGAVVLGQVAHLRSGDLGLMRMLVDLPIGRAPRVGDSVRLERDALADWIAHRARGSSFRILWEGAEASQVIAAARLVRGDVIAAAAAQSLRTWLQGQSDRYELQVDLPPRDVEAPEGPLRLQPRPLAATQLRKRVVVWVDVWVADRFVRTVPVAFAVSAWRNAAAATAPLDAGAPLNTSVVRASEVDVTSQAAAAAPLAMMEGAVRTRRAVRTGEVIHRVDLERAPTVTRGQSALLRSAAGLVVLESRVEVLQDGWKGDKVRVRAPGATGTVVARVVGPGELEVTQ